MERRRALLVLDNCEHLLDTAGDAAELLLDGTSELRILATSREGLHLEGERIVQVPSLPLRTDAVRMFRERAAAAGAEPLDDEVAAQICERLDGLPLAIELAAARVGHASAVPSLEGACRDGRGLGGYPAPVPCLRGRQAGNRAQVRAKSGRYRKRLPAGD